MPDSVSPRRAIAVAVSLHLLRFAVIWLSLWVAPRIGITGWYAGFAANVACSILAVALMTGLRLWRSTGFLTFVRSPWAALALVPFVLEALLWAAPAGLTPRPPGYGLWALTLLLVGFNEELVSRGVVLTRLRASLAAAPAVVITAVLFGAQHLSAFATGSRGAGDIAGNVLLSAVYGFALAAYQVRYAWIWPLILVHAASDFTVILAASVAPDSWYVLAHCALIALGIVLLRAGRTRSVPPSAGVSGPSQQGKLETGIAPFAVCAREEVGRMTHSHEPAPPVEPDRGSLTGYAAIKYTAIVLVVLIIVGFLAWVLINFLAD